MTTWKRILSCALLLALLAAGMTFAAAESPAFPKAGEWAFDYEPEKTVLRLGEDGSAWFREQDCTWKEEDGFLLLTGADGASLRLRYQVTAERTFIYPQTSYRRQKDVEGQGGLIGIWEGVSDGSTFVFTPAGYFLEDSAFSGTFTFDPEAGTFLLHYGEVFEDTLCYYSVENEILTVEYPWGLVPRQG